MHVPHGLILRPEFQNPGEHSPAPSKSGQAAPPAPQTTSSTEAPGAPTSGKQPSIQETCMGNAPLLVGFIAIFYFLLIRPQQKQEKARKAMLAGLAKGSDVVMNSGLHGTITRIDEQTVTVRVDGDVKLKFDRSAVARVQGGEGADAGKSPAK